MRTTGWLEGQKYGGWPEDGCFGAHARGQTIGNNSTTINQLGCVTLSPRLDIEAGGKWGRPNFELTLGCKWVFILTSSTQVLRVCVCGCEKRKWRGVYVLIHNTCERISMGSVCVGTSVRVQILFSQSGWRACGNMLWKVEGGFTGRGFRTCKQELFCNKHPPRVPRLYFFFLGGSKNRATLIWQPHVHCGLCLLTSNHNQEHIGAHCRTWPHMLLAA